MGGRVGSGQMHTVAALHQAHGQGGGNRGLADTALAHDHDEAVAHRGQFVGQAAERFGGQVNGGNTGIGRGDRHGATAQQCAQCWQAHGVEDAQRHFVTRQAGQGVRHLRDGLNAQRFDGAGGRVVGPAGVKYAVDHEALVRQTQGAQLFGRARSLLHGGAGRAG